VAEGALRMKAWHSVDEAKEDPIVVAVPESVSKYLADRRAHKIQTTIKIQSHHPERLQIDQRSSAGLLLREIVLDINPDTKKATISGYQVLMVKVGEKWQAEPLQSALDEMAKEIVIPAAKTDDRQ